MRRDLPDFKALHARQREEAGEAGLLRLLDAGRAWDLTCVLRAGGSVIFPHTTLETCGHQIAAAVHSCLDSGAHRIVVLGVLHGLNPELLEARRRVVEGGDPTAEPLRGIQGPGLDRRDEWRREFSLDHFHVLWETEVRRRGIAGPELILRYPFLAAGRPEDLPGMEELRDLARDAVVVATMDAFHHGLGYGDPPEAALTPEAGGLDLARRRILEGLELLRAGDYPAYERHCAATRSDGRDTGQLLRHLLGPLRPEILDLAADDMTGPYSAPPPTWVATSLVALHPE
jgi:hypothetical protein